jgi:hypothetical protein
MSEDPREKRIGSQAQPHSLGEGMCASCDVIFSYKCSGRTMTLELSITSPCLWASFHPLYLLSSKEILLNLSMKCNRFFCLGCNITPPKEKRKTILSTKAEISTSTRYI